LFLFTQNEYDTVSEKGYLTTRLVHNAKALYLQATRQCRMDCPQRTDLTVRTFKTDSTSSEVRCYTAPGMGIRMFEIALPKPAASHDPETVPSAFESHNSSH
jgi:hypothetical protein